MIIALVLLHIFCSAHGLHIAHVHLRDTHCRRRIFAQGEASTTSSMSWACNNMENTQRQTGKDPMMLAAALSPYVTGPAWLSYGEHPGEDKLSAAYISAIKNHAGALKAGEGVV